MPAHPGRGNPQGLVEERQAVRRDSWPDTENNVSQPSALWRNTSSETSMSSKGLSWFIRGKAHRLLWLCHTHRFRRKCTSFVIDPNRTYWIDPARIELSVGSRALDRLAGEVPFPCPLFERGKIVGGDWDLRYTRFEDMDVWHAFNHRFVERGQWIETAFYARIVRTISAGIPMWGCTSKEEFDARLQHTEQLFEDIKNNGYRTQKEIKDSLRPFDDEDEVNVHIGRYGDYILANGRHRLCIAKILQLPKIPVKVARRHKQWASFRAEVLAYARKGGKLYAPILHPDLSDIPAAHGHERMEIIKSHLPEKPGRMLDIGAHWGYFCHCFEDLGYDCLAVENSPLNVRFMEKLRRAENRHFEIFAGSIFDADISANIDVVLALNIFHHFLKEDTLHKELVTFLRTLDANVMFFETHKPDEPQMNNSYVNYSPEEFVQFVRSHGRFRTIENIAITPDGRTLFKLVR